MRYVTAATIYRDIVARNGINEVGEESYIRNLRKKMNFAMEKIALRRVSDFKRGRNIVIPANDAPIVRNLIMASLDENFPYVGEWFNGALDISDSEKCVSLFMNIQELIMRAEFECETDSVTVNEWIAAVRGLLNVDTANNTLSMKNKLEKFRTTTLVANNTVRVGDVYTNDDDGNRVYVLQGGRKIKKLSEEMLRDIVKDLTFQNDYFSVLEQIIDFMMNDAEEKAIPYIETYAMVKSRSECKTAFELICGGAEDEKIGESMVSEYYPQFRKIAFFLHAHPEVTRQIEERTETENLEQFFSGEDVVVENTDNNSTEEEIRNF